jgi:thiamine biosynthesis protein ThiI
MDKGEIVAIAKRIGTFDISIRPFEDCCTVFVPRYPSTSPKRVQCEQQEQAFDWSPLVRECIDQAECIEIRAGHPVLFDRETTDAICSLL